MYGLFFLVLSWLSKSIAKYCVSKHTGRKLHFSMSFPEWCGFHLYKFSGYWRLETFLRPFYDPLNSSLLLQYWNFLQLMRNFQAYQLHLPVPIPSYKTTDCDLINFISQKHFQPLFSVSHLTNYHLHFLSAYINASN